MSTEPPARMPGPLASGIGRALRATANVLLILFFGMLALASIQRFTDTQSLRSFSVLVANSLILGLFLLRRPAKSETTDPFLWLLSYTGTMLPLFMRPGDAAPVLAGAGHAIQGVGIVLMVLALLSLQRSFAVVPANRGIRVGGAYRFVRHPLYAAELLLLLGVVLANPSIANAVIWLFECGLQVARAREEERFLASDPEYRAYASRVRFRLVPGLF